MHCTTFDEFCDFIGAKQQDDSPKDHPILFRGNMVRSILNADSNRQPIDPALPYKWQTRRVGQKHYKINDKLWVRETVRVVEINNSLIKVCYQADKTISNWIEYPERLQGKPVVGKCLSYGGFKEVSRLWLEVTNIRLEPLQEITPQDIRAEGIAVYEGEKIVEPVSKINCDIYLDQWIKLWNSINASRGYSWDKNPVVTVVEFSRV